MSKVPRSKTAMLGIDAGDLAFIQSNIAQLPNFKRLFETGIVNSLKTTSELLTGSVWPTFYTGTNPGEHGIYHHLQWDPASMRIRRVTEDWLNCEPFWYELARQGAKVTVADVPMIFPSQLQTGIEVVNWGSHDQLGHFHSNNIDTTNLIRRQFGAHPMGPEIPVTKSKHQIDQIRRNLVAGAKKKGELIQTLLLTTDWDFFLAVFGETHRGGHILWPDKDMASIIPQNALLEVYRAIDTALRGVLECIDFKSTRVILFSLHGMQENLSHEHFVQPVMERINSVFYEYDSSNLNKAPKQHNLMRWLRNKVPHYLQHLIAQSVPVQVRDWVVCNSTSSGYAWQHTPALPLLADYNGYIRLNLKGREQHGYLKLNDEQFNLYTNLLRKSFLELQLPNQSTQLVKDIIDVKNVYAGTRQDKLPDLIVTWNDAKPTTKLDSPSFGSFSAQIATGRSGNHRHEGFSVVIESEPNNVNLWKEVHHIKDLAPTLLRLCSPTI